MDQCKVSLKTYLQETMDWNFQNYLLFLSQFYPLSHILFQVYKLHVQIITCLFFMVNCKKGIHLIKYSYKFPMFILFSYYNNIMNSLEYNSYIKGCLLVDVPVRWVIAPHHAAKYFSKENPVLRVKGFQLHSYVFFRFFIDQNQN